MLKILLVSAAAIVGITGMSGVTTASAASQSVMLKKKIAANGRCNGVSYGTGQRGCGTKTGGPVGGNPSRN